MPSTRRQRLAEEFPAPVRVGTLAKVFVLLLVVVVGGAKVVAWVNHPITEISGERAAVAQEKVRSWVDGLARHLQANATWQVVTEGTTPEAQRDRCRTRLNSLTDYRSISHGLQATIPGETQWAVAMVDQAEVYLEDQGLEVTHRPPRDAGTGRLVAATGGYRVSLVVHEANRVATIKGSTPCVDN